MASAETSPFAGLRARGGAIDGGSAAVVLLLIGAAIFLLVGCLQSALFAQYTIQGLALGSVYGALALALVLVYRATHVINFAQGELAMLTTYIAYQLMQWGLSYWVAFAATLAIAFLLGTLLQVTLIRPVQHSVIAWSSSRSVSSSSSTGRQLDLGRGVQVHALPVRHRRVRRRRRPDSASVRLDDGVVLASALLVWALFRFTKLGLGMRAAALRPAAAALVGVRVDSMLAIGWGLAAVLGAVAGLMAEPSQLFLTPSFMQPILVYAFAAAVLGGLESPAGALVGGVAIGVSLTLIVGYVPQNHRHRAPASPRVRGSPPDPAGEAVGTVRAPGGAAGMRKQIPALASLLVVAAVLCLLPFVLSNYNVSLAAQVGIFFIGVLGLNILTGYTGQISIGHGAFMAIGGYTTAVMSRDHNTNLVVTMLMAFAICFVVGLIVGLPALRFSGVYLALVTFALAVSVPQIPLQYSTFLGGVGGVSIAEDQTVSNLWIYVAAWTCSAILFALAWLLCAAASGGRSARSATARSRPWRPGSSCPSTRRSPSGSRPPMPGSQDRCSCSRRTGSRSPASSPSFSRSNSSSARPSRGSARCGESSPAPPSWGSCPRSRRACR